VLKNRSGNKERFQRNFIKCIANKQNANDFIEAGDIGLPLLVLKDIKTGDTLSAESILLYWKVI